MQHQPTRQSVIFALDRAVSQWVRAHHLTEIHGVGQRKRYERAITHADKAIADLNAAIYLLHQLVALQQED